MLGQRRCRMHGGSSPQARAAAADRLMALVAPAVRTLDRSMKGKGHVALTAARDVLDRTGLKHAGEQTISMDDLLTLTGSITRLFLEVVEDRDLRLRFAAGLRRLVPPSAEEPFDGPALAAWEPPEA